ncbi:MAG: rhodanese-like domain-containing protein [Elusimicrobia bacterium]|nr:rhodanese-like domain-containing protein [Candidatus Obscuribacterium magneticum]
MFKQAAFILFISLAAGALRQLAPGGLSWKGLWPTSATSAYDAYKMMAQPGDPPFIDLSEAVRRHSEKGVFFLDARSSDEFLRGHIAGARSLPYYEWDKVRFAALENVSPDAPVIVYCEGITCELSFFLGRELARAGYTNVKIFYGGFPEWQKAGLPTEK